MTSHMEFLESLLVQGQITMTGGGWGTRFWYAGGVFGVMAIGDILLYQGGDIGEAYDIFRKVEMWQPVYNVENPIVRRKAFVQMLYLSLPYTYELNKGMMQKAAAVGVAPIDKVF